MQIHSTNHILISTITCYCVVIMSACICVTESDGIQSQVCDLLSSAMCSFCKIDCGSINQQFMVCVSSVLFDFVVLQFIVKIFMLGLRPNQLRFSLFTNSSSQFC